MARGTSIKRIREYFKLGDIEEVEVVLQLVQGDVSKRQCVVSQPALPFHKKSRKPRRTNAQKIADENAQHAKDGGYDVDPEKVQ